jgi:YD repeat-containing protein
MSSCGPISWPTVRIVACQIPRTSDSAETPVLPANDGAGKGNGNTLYSFNITSFAPNSDILASSDSVNGNWTYSYDAFNRLVGSNQNSGAAVYDRFGNRWQQNGPQTFLATFTGNNQGNPQNNNRMDGYSYDTAGNMTSDGTHTYTYDAENRMIQVDGGSTATYSYDVDGHRVEKVSATGNYSDPAGTYFFLYDQSGRFVLELGSGYTLVRGHIYAGSRSRFRRRLYDLQPLGLARHRTFPHLYGQQSVLL